MYKQESPQKIVISTIKKLSENEKSVYYESKPILDDYVRLLDKYFMYQQYMPSCRGVEYAVKDSMKALQIIRGTIETGINNFYEVFVNRKLFRTIQDVYKKNELAFNITEFKSLFEFYITFSDRKSDEYEEDGYTYETREMCIYQKNKCNDFMRIMYSPLIDHLLGDIRIFMNKSTDGVGICPYFDIKTSSMYHGIAKLDCSLVLLKITGYMVYHKQKKG